MKNGFIGGYKGDPNIEEYIICEDEIFEDEIDTEDYMRWYNEEKEKIASIITTEPIIK